MNRITSFDLLFFGLISSCSRPYGWQIAHQPLPLPATNTPAGDPFVQLVPRPLACSAAANARMVPMRKQTTPPRGTLCCIHIAGHRLYLYRTQSGYQAWVTASHTRFASQSLPVYVVPGYSMAQFLAETPEIQSKKISLIVGSTKEPTALQRGLPRGTYVQIGGRIVGELVSPFTLVTLGQELVAGSAPTTVSLLRDRSLFPMVAPLVQLHSVEPLQVFDSHSQNHAQFHFASHFQNHAQFHADGSSVPYDPFPSHSQNHAQFHTDGSSVPYDPFPVATIRKQSKRGVVPAAASNAPSEASLSLDALDRVPSTYISREGHRVAFVSQGSGRWYATIDERAPVGLRRMLHHVRVCCALGYSVEALSTYDAAVAQCLLQVTLPHSGGAGWVYIGPWELGGLKPKREEAIEAHKTPKAERVKSEIPELEGKEADKLVVVKPLMDKRTKKTWEQIIAQDATRYATPHRRRRRSDSDDSDDEEQLTKDSKLIDAITNKTLSTEQQRIDIIKEALNQGANINFQDKRRKEHTPLHLAVKAGQSKVVEFLLKQKNIKVNIENKNGKTPLELAKKLSNQEMVELLENQGKFTLENAASEDRPRETVPLTNIKPQSGVKAAISHLKRTHATLGASLPYMPSKRKKTSAEISGYVTQEQETESILPPFSGQLKIDVKLQLKRKNFKQSIQALLKSQSSLIASDILKAVPAYPTPYLLAQFASKAYTDYKEKEYARDYEARLSLPAGWKLLTTASNKDKTNGYFGVAYWHPEHRQVVLAHRGTKPTTLGADWTDFKGILFNHYVAQMNSAATFSDRVVATLKEITQEKNVHFQLFFTGHSLGGWLAQITTFTTEFLKRVERKDGACFLKSDESAAYHAHTVVFESPGAKAMLLQMEDKLDVRYQEHSIDLQTLDITSYLSAPNRINTCNKHLGTLYRIFVDVSKMSWGEQKSMTYNLATHKMDKILEVFDPTTGEVKRDSQGRFKIQEIVDWPIATGLLGEEEWKKFFKWANHLNDYHPEITDEKFSVSGYHPLRYQTKPYNEKTISLNVFTQEERQFLERYRWLQQLPEFFKPESLFSKLSAEYQGTVVQQLSQFNLDNGQITDTTASALRTFIPYVKTLIQLSPDLLEKTQAVLQDVGIRKRVYQFETQACIKEIEAKPLDIESDILGVEQLLHHAEEQVWQLKVAHTQLGLIALYRCWQRTPTYLKYQQSKAYTLTLLKTKRLLAIHQQISLTELLNVDEIQSHLLIVAEDSNTISNPEEAQKIFEELLPILNKKRGIKVIVINKKGAPFTETLKQKAQAQLGKHFISKETLPLSWDMLTSEAQQKLLGKTVLFQGEAVSLNQLITADSLTAQYLPIAQLLDEELIHIGKFPSHSSGYDTDFYIGRTFKKITKSKAESDYLSPINTHTVSILLSEQQLLAQQTPRMLLITDNAGMGKTTVLTHLSQQIKEQNPSDWVVKIDLNDHTTALDKLNDRTSPAEFLAKVLLKIKEKSLEQSLFEQFFQEQRVVLLLDGFDEISPAYKEKAITLLQQLKKSALKQLWVTTRPHLKEDLEKVLDQTAYTLEPFSEENQIDFLVNYWRHKNQAFQGVNAEEQAAIEHKLRTYAQQLINKLAASVNDKEKAFTGIPLQTQLLADAFEEELATAYKADKKLPTLPEKLDLLDLYEEFLKGKYEIFGAKGLLAKEQQANISLEGVNLPKNHQRLALQVLLTEEEFSSLQLKPLKKALKKEDLARIGIASLNDENKPQFIHRTFAEYFTAKFFVERLKDEKKAINHSLQDFFLKEILLQEEYQVVRAFINGFWKKEECFPQEAILKSYGQQIEQLWQKKGDKRADGTILYRMIREDNGQVITFLQKSLKEHVTTAKEFLLATDSYGQTTWQRAVYWGEFEVFDKLWAWSQECLTPEERKNNWLLAQDNYGKTVWHQAAAKGSVEVLEKLWFLGKKELTSEELKNKWLLAKDNYGKTAWHVMAFWGRVEELNQLWAWAKERFTSEELKNKWLLAKDNNGQTAWHLAAFWGRVAVLEKLWSWDQEVKLTLEERKNNWLLATDNDGKTAWHRAAESEKVEVLDKLWAWSQDLLSKQELKDKLLLAKDNDGQTAWHRTAYWGKVEVLEKLWEATPMELKKELLLAKDNDGQIAWHQAAAKGRVEVLEKLWAWGQDLLSTQALKDELLLAKDNKGQTAWHGAAKYEQIEVLEKLWAWGQDLLSTQVLKDELLLAKDNKGQTAWHGATKYEKIEVLEKLWTWYQERLTPEELKNNLLLAKDNKGQTTWHWAAEYGKIKVLEKLWAWSQDLLSTQALKDELLLAKDNNEQTAWHGAAEKGKVLILEKLWAWGQTCLTPEELKKELLLAKDNKGQTAWHGAAEKGKVLVLEKLWAWGQERLTSEELKKDLLLAKDNDGQTAWHGVVVHGWVKVLDKLWTWGQERLTPEELKKELLLAKNNKGQTAWQGAAEKGKVSVLEKLWAWGQEHLTPEELKNNWLLAKIDGKTTWHWAAANGRVKVLEKLWTWGQAVKLTLEECKNNWLLAKIDGKTAWHLAAANGMVKVLDKLWAWGQERLTPEELKNNWLLDTDNKENTAWRSAAEMERVEVLEKLWTWCQERLTPEELKKDLLLAKDNKGQTAWQGAAEKGKVPVLEKLWTWGQERLTPEELKKDLLLNKDNKGQTAWQGAAEKGKILVLEKLWTWGQAVLTPEELKNKWLLDIDKDNNGQTTWHGVAANGGVKVLEKLWSWGQELLTPEELKKDLLLAKNNKGQTALELFQSNTWLDREKKEKAKNLIKGYLEEVEKKLQNPAESLKGLNQRWAELGVKSHCSSLQRRKNRSLTRCAENERRTVFPYEPWVDQASSAVQQVGHAYRLLALAVAWQQGEVVTQVERGIRHLGDILAEGVENQSQREHLILLEQAQQTIDFFIQNPKEKLLEPWHAEIAPSVGQSVLLENGQQSLLLLNAGEQRYQIYSPNFNYRQSFTTRPGISWPEVIAFAQAFLRWKSGSEAYQAFGLKTPFPAAAERALHTSLLWKPDLIAPDRVLLERQGSLVEGLPLSALRQLFRAKGEIPALAALQESFFTQQSLTLAIEALHTVLLELSTTQRQALSRVVQRYAIVADPHWIKGLEATEQPLGQAYQQKVLQLLHQGKEVTPEQLSQFSWQIFREAFDQYPEFTPELKQKVFESTQNMQQQAGERNWVKGIALQALFFLPDMLRAANIGNVSGLATTAGMLAADSTVNELYSRLLKRLAPALSESRLELLQKLPVTSPVFKGLTIYSIVELTQQLHTLPRHSEQRSAIQHRLGEQYVTIGIMAAELLGFEATPLWLGLMAEQLIFEALNFSKERHLDIPFWEAFLMNLGFEQQKLQHIIDERQLVEANLAMVEQLNQQPILPYGWVLMKIPRLSDAHWRTTPEAQIPKEIRESIVEQPEQADSTPKKGMQEINGYRFVRNYQTYTIAVGRAARTVRGPSLGQAWQRKYFNTTAQAVTFDLVPSNGAYQEDNFFLERPETDALKHYQRISTVATQKRRYYVKNPPVQIDGPGLGALYINHNQSQPHNGQGRNLYYAFDPNEGDTTLRVTTSGLQALTTRYQLDHPATHNTSNTVYHITVQLSHKSYPDQISVPPTQQPALWSLNDLHQQLNSHYWIGTLQRPCYIHDNCPTNQLAFATEPGCGYQLQSQGHEMIQLYPLAANRPSHTLWLKGMKRYLMLQLKGQQVKQLTLNAQQVELFDISGAPTAGEVYLSQQVQRFTLTITGAITIRHSTDIMLEVKGQIAQVEPPMHYRTSSDLQRSTHYQLVVSSLQPLLSTIKLVESQHITWNSSGLTNRWKAPWYRQESTFLHISATAQPHCSLLLSHATLTLVQLDNTGQPSVTLVNHVQPVAQLESTGRLQKLFSERATEWLQNLTPEAVAFVKSWDRGIVLQWQTPNGAQQWHRFPSEQMTLNGIHYQVYNNQLEAIGAEDNVIRGEQLLTTLNGAPLAIRLNQSLAESQLRWENDTLILNNLTLSHLPFSTPIYFNQQGFTWATLQETLQPPAKPQAGRRRSLPAETVAPVASDSTQPRFWLSHLVKKVVETFSSLPRLWQWSSPSMTQHTRGDGVHQEMPTAGWTMAFHPAVGPSSTADATPTLVGCGDRWLAQTSVDGLLVWSDFLGRCYQHYKRKPMRTISNNKPTAPPIPTPSPAEVALHTEEIAQAFLTHLQATAVVCGLTEIAAQRLVERMGVSPDFNTRLRQSVARGELMGIPEYCYQAVAQQYKELRDLSSAVQATALLETLKNAPVVWPTEIL